MKLLVIFLTIISLTQSVNPEGSLVNKLMSQRDTLMQEGLSFFNGTTVKIEQEKKTRHDIRCLVNIDNWTKWLLGYPTYYTKYGVFQNGEFSFILLIFKTKPYERSMNH